MNFFTARPLTRFLCAIARFLLCPLGVWLAFPAPAHAQDIPRLIAEGKVNTAIVALNERLHTNGNDAEAHNLLCRAYFEEEQWDRAIAECQRSVSLDANNGRHQLWLGRAQGRKAEHASFVIAATLAPKVRTAFEHAVQLAPDDMAARADLSEYYIEAPGFMGGGIDKAEAQAAIIARHDPPLAHWLRAAIAEHRKQPDVAESEYKNAVRESKDPAAHLLDLASFYYHAGRISEMEDTVNRMAAASIKEGPELFDGAGLLLRAGRNFPGAIALLRRYLAGEGRSEAGPACQAEYRLGVLLEKTGDIAGAQAAYKSAVELASDYAAAQAALHRMQKSNR